MRQGLHAILGRIVTVIAVLVVVGLILRLIVGILKPVLPGQFMTDLGAGFEMLYGMVSPAMPAIMAILLLVAIVWVVTGKNRLD